MGDLNLIRQRIKSRREQLKYSYQTLADLTHLSKSTLQRYETGKIGNLPLDKLETIANALKCSPAYLMGWQNDMFDHIDNKYVNMSFSYPTPLTEHDDRVVSLDSKDDSMPNTFPIGCQVTIDTQAVIKNGDYVAALLHDGSGVLRLYSVPDGGEIAVLVDEKGRSQLVDSNVRIIGKVLSRCDTKYFY